MNFWNGGNMEKVEKFIQELMATRDVLRLYSDSHPEFLEATKKAFSLLDEILEEHNELVIGIVGNEFTYKKEIFFTLSARLQNVIEDLKKRGVERITFYRGVQNDELNRFLAYVGRPLDSIQEDFETYSSHNNIKHITTGKIKGGVSEFVDAGTIDPAILAEGYQQSLNVVSNNVESCLDERLIDYQTLKFTVNHVMINLLDRYQDFLKLGTVKRYDEITFIHLLNVSILAMHFAAQLGFEKQDIFDIGIAALFHDIGKLYISRRILTKPGKLEVTEFDRMQSHAQLGAEIMLRHVDSLGELPVIITYEHHVKYNGKGYPKLPSYYKPHAASSLVSLCDVYDALRQRRSYKRNYPPEMAYAIMKKARGESFDPVLFDKFFFMVGIWPTGTIVELSDSRIGIVREQNREHLTHPVIEVVGPQATHERINLEEHRDILFIEKSLNPHEEGKEYYKFL